MNKDIAIANPIDKSKLKSDDYFKSLVNEALKEEILTSFHIEKIQTSLIEILKGICENIAQNGNSSIRQEVAEKIANSIMYTVSLALKMSQTPQLACERLKNEKTEDLFLQGQKEIRSLKTLSRGTQASILKDIFETENEYYNSAVNETAKEFFIKYNEKTRADDSVVNFEYPLYVNGEEEIGIEYVYSYLETFKIENSFLKKFDKENVDYLMCLLDDELGNIGFPFEKGAYKKIPVNIFSYVFSSALLLEYLEKSPFDLFLKVQDVEKFEELLKDKDYAQTVRILDGLCGKLAFEISADESMRNYMRKAVRTLALELSNKNKSIFSVFPCFKDKEIQTQFFAKENRLLSNSEYRNIVFTLQRCQSEEKMLSDFKKYFVSSDDFSDAVKDLKLTKAQIFHCLDFLDMWEKIRLFKKYNIFSYCLSDEDRQMKNILEIYVSSLKKEEKEHILKLVSLMK